MNADRIGQLRLRGSWSSAQTMRVDIQLQFILGHRGSTTSSWIGVRRFARWIFRQIRNLMKLISKAAACERLD